MLRSCANLSHLTLTETTVGRMEAYYEARAPEYDATTYELLEQDPDLAALEGLVAGLEPGVVLDVGCGTGWLTGLLRGTVVALDASPAMLRLTRRRVPHALLVLGSVPPLPFPERSFDRVFASHLYGHLENVGLRRAFVAECQRVAGELVVVEQTWRAGLPREAHEARQLRDGSVHHVFKRYFAADDLAGELSGEVVLETPTFVAVRSVSG